MHIGPVRVGTIHDWTPSPGPVVSWEPSSEARAKAAAAPVSSVPASYMQAQHLHGYHDQVVKGLDYSRLLIATCEVAGQCDIRTMTYIINTHLRRHDTYRSWFQLDDTNRLVRHTMPDAADIEFVPAEHGELSPEDLHAHVLSTPDPFQWDCFRFGIVQGADHFSFYTSVDHLHMDATFAIVMVTEFHMMYGALIGGGPPVPLPDAGSYDEFCARQRAETSALTVDTPRVRAWIEFGEHNDKSLPVFPLPLGDPSCRGALITQQLLDEQQAARFESACIAAGARFSGGVFACAALSEHELTGIATYYGLTPSDTRSTPTDFLTMGWFTGLVPITVPVQGAGFDETARAAQRCFDEGTELAQVPWDRVVELAPWLNRPPPNFPVINYIDGGVAPFSGVFSSMLEGLHLGIWFDARYSYQFTVFVNRMEKETAMAVLYPDNPVARESVSRYLDVMRSWFLRIADSPHGSDVA